MGRTRASVGVTKGARVIKRLLFGYVDWITCFRTEVLAVRRQVFLGPMAA